MRPNERFNPPPNRETIRPGWTPPQGWKPDESYPPIPDAWQIWIEEDPSRRKAGIVVLGTAQAAFNDADAQTYAASFCPGTFDGPAPTTEELQAQHSATGDVTYSIDNLKVSGAVAEGRLNLSFASGAKYEAGTGPNVEFRDVDGGGKICTLIQY